jgi:hypothetical protein
LKFLLLLWTALNCLSATGQTISSLFFVGFDLGMTTDASRLNQLLLSPVNENLGGDLNLQSESKNVSIRSYAGAELFNQVIIELGYSRLNIYQDTTLAQSQSRILYSLGAQDIIQGYELRIAKKVPLGDTNQSIQLGLGVTAFELNQTVSINNNATLGHDPQSHGWGETYFVGYEKKLTDALAFKATFAKQFQNAFGQSWPLATWSLGLCNYL